MKKQTIEESTPITCDPHEVSYREIEVAMTALSGKWKMLVIWKLWEGKMRFGDLKGSLPGVTQHMLTSTLRDLEREGLVERKAFAEIPPRVEYSLTRHALTLESALTGLKIWGKSHIQFKQKILASSA
ncbi:MAG: helix-turn-helix transcriptional regulator [Chitinophagaceae bacterium]|nr:helix-turn-helix transcriptional regulator [Rubrivivax sp.]